MIPDTSRIPSAQGDCAETRAREAFAAHKAMLEAERMRPALRCNPAWTVLRQDAYENFALAFEALQ